MNTTTCPSAPLPRVCDGVRLYVIGDVHGRRDLLDTLLARIEADIATIPVGSPLKTRLVFLGDLIDRGSDPKGVLVRLMQKLPASEPPVFLMGNHEWVFLRLFESTEYGAGWLHYGGRTTLASFDLPCPVGEPSPTDLALLQQSLREHFPREIRTFLRSFSTHYLCGDYFFVHAGVRMDRPLDQQSERDLLWSRTGFLEKQPAHEKIIVHGHTITREVEFLPHRIGLDTGAYASGILTALVLEGTSRRLIQTDAEAEMIFDRME